MPQNKFGTNQLRHPNQFQIKTYNYPQKLYNPQQNNTQKQMASLNIVLSLNKLFAFRLSKLRKRTKLKHKIASE